MIASKDGHQPKCKQCSAKYEEDNSERIAERKRRYYQGKRQKIIEAQAAYRAENKPKIAARMVAYYSENKEAYSERGKKRRVENPEAVSANMRAARARKKAAEGTHSGADVRSIYLAQRGLCANCRSKLFKSGPNKYHVDHIMPLARGGSNDKLNLQCLCKTCNLRKNAKDPISWAAENGRLL